MEHRQFIRPAATAGGLASHRMETISKKRAPLRSRAMYMVSAGLWTIIGILWLIGAAYAQTPAPSAAGDSVRPIGVVTTIDAVTKLITIKTDAGSEMAVRLQDSTSFMRVPPGEKDLKNAAKILMSDIGIGDRVLARGRVSEDKKSVLATSVIVMTKADIAKKHEADRAEWQRRGIAGIITSVNAESKEITVSTRTSAGAKPVVVALAPDAGQRRYAPDSIKFSEAKVSAFPELKVGDQIRALGTKSEDGTRFMAEQLVSGSFRNVAGTVTAIDPKENTIKITDLDTKKPLMVRIREDSTLRKIPPFVAQMLAMRNAGGRDSDQRGPGGPPRSSESGAPGGNRPPRPAGAGMGPGGTPGRGMMAREGTPDFQQMLERMPNLTLADLKPGDALIIASTSGADPAQITAITVLAGVEPLLTASPQGGRQMVIGAWTLDMNMSMP